MELNDRIHALAAHLGRDVEELEPGYGDEIELGRESYRVLTDAEADAAVVEYVRDTLWAFDASFLASETGLPSEMFEALQHRCEGANDAFLTVIERSEGGLEGFAESAVSSDGRGHFLAGYDGYEVDLGSDLYAYRTN